MEVEVARAAAAEAAGVDLALNSHLRRVVAIENAGTVSAASRIRRQSFMALAVLAARPAGSRTVAKSAAEACGSARAAIAIERDRFAAVLTLAVAASGLGLGGIGSAFWGHLTGLTVLTCEGAARAWREGRGV